MSDAQLGLAVATPILVGFALAMNRIGVLQRTGTVLAIGTSMVIGLTLFLTQ